MSGLFLTRDLMFSSRVTGQARAAGRVLDVVPSIDAAQEKIRQGNVELLIIDLAGFAADIDSWLPSLRAEHPSAHVVAYGPHVDETMLHAARQAGCDEVLSRGQFHQTAGEILVRHLPATDN